jgi:hypothetical protein
MRKATIAALALVLAATMAEAGSEKKTDAKEGVKMRRFMVVRTFPAGALAGLDAVTKARVNSRNEASGARWVHSYATADLTKTFCVYEGRDEAAIRKAAAANQLPIDQIFEIPADLTPR